MNHSSHCTLASIHTLRNDSHKVLSPSLSIRKTGKNRAYREIRMIQRNNSLLVPGAAVIRTIREAAQSINPDLRFSMDALSVIQEAAEMYLVQMFQEASPLFVHRNRVTVMLCDIQLVFHLIDRHNFFTYKRTAERYSIYARVNDLSLLVFPLRQLSSLQ